MRLGMRSGQLRSVEIGTKFGTRFGVGSGNSVSFSRRHQTPNRGPGVRVPPPLYHQASRFGLVARIVRASADSSFSAQRRLIPLVRGYGGTTGGTTRGSSSLNLRV